MDDRLYTLFCDFVDDFRLMKTADKEAHRGVGLGSEVSQIIALDYASPIDHYVKDVRGIHGYGRYMDDGVCDQQFLGGTGRHQAQPVPPG